MKKESLCIARNSLRHLRQNVFARLLLLVCGVMMSSCVDECCGDEGGTVNLEVGDVVPAFTVTKNDGRTVTSESLRGGPSLIVFFHTGCKDCRNELPVLQRIYNDYANQVKMVFISREEKASEIASYWKEHGLTLPYSAQEDRTVYHLFAKTGIPRIYVSDGNLVIRSIFTDNPLATYEDIAEAIARVKE